MTSSGYTAEVSRRRLEGIFTWLEEILTWRGPSEVGCEVEPRGEIQREVLAGAGEAGKMSGELFAGNPRRLAGAGGSRQIAGGSFAGAGEGEKMSGGPSAGNFRRPAGAGEGGRTPGESLAGTEKLSAGRSVRLAGAGEPSAGRFVRC